MKKLITLSFSVFIFFGVSSGQNETHMYTSLYLSPKPGHGQQLNTALSTHNKLFHSEEPYTAFVQFVITGKRSTDYCWLMGPHTFSDLDNEPFGSEAHDNDWNNNVLPHVVKESNIEYWQRDNELFIEQEEGQADKLHLHFVKTKQGKAGQFREHFKDIIEVHKQKNYPGFIGLYWNRFPTAHDRDVAGVESFSSWAQFDDDNWSSDFEEVHGEGSWAKWLETLFELVEWVDQEVRQLMPGLSGME